MRAETHGAAALLRDRTEQTLGVVICVRVTSPEAKQNLTFVLEGLLSTDVDQIVVMEERSAEQPPTSLPAKIVHRVRPLEGPLRRAKLVNEAARNLEVDRIWVHDPDLVLPFDAVVPQIRDCPRAALKPFAWMTKLGKKASRRVLETKDLTAEIPADAKRLGETIGKASFVIDRDLFLTAGGLSEAFRGPADEGFELFRRLRPRLQDLPALNTVGVQLFRPKDPNEATAKEANQRLRTRLAQRIDQDVDNYLLHHLETGLSPNPRQLAHLSALDERDRILRPSAVHPPPTQPTVSNGSLWALACYFNPAGYQSKKDNFDRFRAGLAKTGVPLLVVELAFGNEPFVFSKHDVDRHVALRTNDWGLLWQKERLLNLGLEALPDACDKVAWLDGDILFARPDWPTQTAKALEQYPVVQCFSLSVRLEPGETEIDVNPLPLGASEHEVLHGIAYGHAAHGPSCLDRYLVHGHSGYAWAARRSLFARHGFYDRNILGNGDLNIAHAVLGGGSAIRTDRLSPAAQRDVKGWADQIYADVQGSVGFVEGLVYHLWHGSKQDRRYHERLDILTEADFDPTTDLILDDNELYRWTGDKPNLQNWCRAYFQTRREDG